MSEPDILAGKYAFVGSQPRTGGFSVVKKAVDLRDGTPVAVKFVLGVTDEVTHKAFERELRSLRTLSHENVVKLVDGGVEEGTGHPYLVLEWIDRNLVNVWETEGQPTWDELLKSTAEPLVSALAHAHLKGVEHRDIKPTNVLVRDNGQPVLADFGIAKLRESIEQSGMTLSAFRSGPYAPPEMQAPMRYVRDVYSMGVLLIQAMHSGRITDFHEVAPALAAITVPPDVRSLLERCVDPDPSARPENGSVMREELRRITRLQTRLRATPDWTAWLKLSVTAKTQLAESFIGDNSGTSEAALEADLAGDVFLELRFDHETQERDRGTVFMVGERGRYTLKPDAGSGVLWVVSAKLQEYEVLESFRRRALLVGRSVSWSCRDPRDREAAASTRDFLIDSLEDFHRIQAERRTAGRQRFEGDDLFEIWENILKAREEVARGDRKPLRYRARRVTGREATFTLTETPESDLVGGEVEVVIPETNRSVGVGEIIDQEDNTVTVRSRRAFRTLPEAAILKPYLGPTQIALNRQQEALAAVRDRTAARPDFRDIVLDPGVNASPSLVDVRAWKQELDASKREAVAAALGATDVLLVQGPPGTGKTSFITEFIAQYLEREPSARVLIVSQTHVAVDNALERLAAAGVERLVRLGEPEDARVDQSVWPYLLDRQMAIWSSQVRRRAEDRLERDADAAGISTHHLRAALALQQFCVVVRELEAVESHLVAAETSTDSDLITSLGISADAAALQERLDRLAEQREELIAQAQRELAGDLTVRADMTTADATTAIEVLVGETGRGQTLLGLLALQAEWLQRVASDQNLAAAFLKTTRVIAGTCLGFLRYSAMRDVEIDLCVLDEASKATTTEALVPLQRAKRWVLVGDTNQLPPMDEDLLRNREVMAEYELDEAVVKETLFQRFADGLPEHSQRKLLEQYRMIRPIGDLISTVFYGGELKSPRTTGLKGYELLGKPVLWMDTSRLGDSRRESAPEGAGTSYTNRTETRLLAERLKSIDLAIEKGHLEMPVDSQRLVTLVIAPYRAQVEDLRRKLAGVHLSHLDISVQSVDAVQGKEADIVLFSVTRSNARGAAGLGFLGPDFWRRINVALSRARFGLMIIGDAEFCSASPGALNSVVQYIREHASDCELRVIYDA